MEPQKWIDKYQDSAGVNRVQIYEDRGKGYQEEASYFVKEAYQGEQLIEFSLSVGADVQMLRIDPAMDSCMVTIQEMTWNGERVPLEKRKLLRVNGRVAKPAGQKTTAGEALEKTQMVYQPTIVFPTSDPNINIAVSGLPHDKEKPSAENLLYVRMEIVRLPLKMAQDMAGAVKKLI